MVSPGPSELKVMLVAVGEAATDDDFIRGLISELERRKMRVLRTTVADAEDDIEQHGPHLVVLCGTRGAAVISTLLDDGLQGTRPRLVVTAPRAELAKLQGLNRNVVAGLLASDLGERLVVERLQSLARQAAHLRQGGWKKTSTAGLGAVPPASPSTAPRPSANPTTPEFFAGVDSRRMLDPLFPSAKPAAPEDSPIEAPRDSEPGMTVTDSELEPDDREVREAKRPLRVATPAPGMRVVEAPRPEIKERSLPPPLPKEAEPVEPAPKSEARPAAEATPPRVDAPEPEKAAPTEVAPEKPSGSMKAAVATAPEKGVPAEGAPAEVAPAEAAPADVAPAAAPPSSAAPSSAAPSPAAPSPEESPSSSAPEEERARDEAVALSLAPEDAILEEAMPNEVAATESTPPAAVTADAGRSEPERWEGAPTNAAPAREEAPSSLAPEERSSAPATPAPEKPASRRGKGIGIVAVLGVAAAAAYVLSPLGAPAERPRVQGAQSEPAAEPLAKRPHGEHTTSGSQEPAAGTASESPAKDADGVSADDEAGDGAEPPAVADPLLVVEADVKGCDAILRGFEQQMVDPVQEASLAWKDARDAIVKGNLELAERKMCEAVQLHTESAALEGLAMLYVTERAPKRALGYLDRAEAVRPATTETINLRGDILSQLGDADGALAAWLRALKLEPEDTTRRRATAREFDKQGQGHLRRGALPQAERWFRRAAALDPDNITALNGLAEVFLQTERSAEAAAMARRALEVSEYNPQAHVVLGDVARAAGDIAAARGSYERALQVRSDHWSAKARLRELAQEQ